MGDSNWWLMRRLAAKRADREMQMEKIVLNNRLWWWRKCWKEGELMR